ncbi:MAG: hypothetical protein ACI4EI_13360 [Muricoprocola sp.]
MEETLGLCVTVQVSLCCEVFCFAKPEVCNEKAITAGDFAWLFHRYWNVREQITIMRIIA